MEDDAVPVAEAESLLHKQEEHKEEDESKQQETETEVTGGLLDHIIHNLVSPLSPRSSSPSPSSGDHARNRKKAEAFGSNDESDRGFGSEEEMGSSSGAGLIKNVISNFFHPSDHHQQQQQQQEGAEVAENEAETVKSEKEKEQVKKEDGAAAGGIIGNIVSHFPTSLPLPGDVAPTTDEASILIHSIIHD